MVTLSRRQILRTGSAVGLLGLVPQLSRSTSTSASPDLEKYVQPLPVPSVRDPDGTEDGTDVYEIPMTEFTKTFHPDLPETTVWGLEDQHPGPTIEAHQGRPVALQFDNTQLPDTHLLDVDTRIPGTTAENHPGYDGSVPAVRTSIHPHGLNIAPESDGQADMWTSPGGTTGPRFETDVQELPNEQARMTSFYHDHAIGISRLNVYAGLVGLYTITSDAEENLALPSGEYDIPLVLQDKQFNDDGSLEYPSEFESEWFGDTAVVNGAVWPSLEVEPRRYRFRLANGANHRTFALRLENQTGEGVPTFYQFAPDHSFLESVAPVGPAGDMEYLVLTPFERAEVVVDFSDHAGETFVLANDAEFPYTGANDGPFIVDEVMEVRVTDPADPPEDPTADPTALDLPSPPTFDEDAARTTRHHVLEREENEELGLTEHLLNGYGFGDEEALFEPHLGTTEVWELENTTPHAHAIHLHLVTFEVVGRGPDGTEKPDPNERGPKDTVRVDPDETVRIVPRFDGFTGQFPWHCHMLEHEEFSMMTPFRVVRSAATYADEEGTVGFEGLNAAVDDWRDGEVDFDLLRDVIDAWRSGESVS